MSREKTLEVCQQIRDALALKRMQYKDLWALFDANKDNNISYAEFLSGMQQIVTMSTPILEQLFAVMDKDNNGMINYQEFLEVIRLNNLNKNAVEDNFDWEQGIIHQIKEWI